MSEIKSVLSTALDVLKRAECFQLTHISSDYYESISVVIIKS